MNVSKLRRRPGGLVDKRGFDALPGLVMSQLYNMVYADAKFGTNYIRLGVKARAEAKKRKKKK